MKAKQLTMDEDKKSFIGQVIKGALSAISLALVLILLFAVLIRFTSLSDQFIKPVNQVIKIVCILFGVKLSLKHDKQKGWLKGLLIGFIFSVIAYLLFSILSMEFSFGLTTIVDIVFSSLIGLIAGVLLVNLQK